MSRPPLPLLRRIAGFLLLAVLAAAMPTSAAFAAPPRRHTPAPDPVPPPPPAPAPQPTTAAELLQAKYQRIQLPGVGGKPFFYTIEVPADWVVYEENKLLPGLWIGPPDGQAGDPRMIYVRVTSNSLASAEAAAKSLRRADAADLTWSASVIDIKELGGVRGLLVQIDTGPGGGASSTLSLRLPLNRSSAEFWFGGNRFDFAKLRPFYERVLLSVLPFK